MSGQKAQRATDYLDHIIEAIARIETYVQGLVRRSIPPPAI
jgi:uncharacterized protein with HEPN domain